MSIVHKNGKRSLFLKPKNGSRDTEKPISRGCILVAIFSKKKEGAEKSLASRKCQLSGLAIVMANIDNPRDLIMLLF